MTACGLNESQFVNCFVCLAVWISALLLVMYHFSEDLRVLDAFACVCCSFFQEI